MKQLDREHILFKLNALSRKLACMNNEDFGKHLNGNKFEIKFDSLGFSEPSKTTTHIVISKDLI